MLRFIHISDTHIGPNPDFSLHGRNTFADAQNLIHYLNHQLDFEPDFVVHTGDVTNTPDAESAQLAGGLFANLRFPVYYVSGNHDSRRFMRQYLQQAPPSDERLSYDFQQADVHFIVLDTRGEIDPQGYVDEEQLNWLADVLSRSPASSLCLLIHHLPMAMHVPWFDRDMRIMNDDALFSLLIPHRERLRGVFFGHIHRALTGFRDGILCSATASGSFQFFTSPHHEEPHFDTMARGGFAIVTLTDSQTLVTHHTLPR